jgi:hypothetical protein
MSAHNRRVVVDAGLMATGDVTADWEDQLNNVEASLRGESAVRLAGGILREGIATLIALVGELTYRLRGCGFQARDDLFLYCARASYRKERFPAAPP